MKYLLREVGWVFNDSTYDNDGLYRNLALYATKSEAHARKRPLSLNTSLIGWILSIGMNPMGITGSILRILN